MTTLPQTTPMRLPRPSAGHLAIPAANGHPGPGQVHAAGTSLTGADIWRVIRANLWLIIGLLVASAVGGYFGNMWLAQHYARYTSSSLIRVQDQNELPQIGDEARSILTPPSPQAIEVEQKTQTAALQNPYFLSQVLDDPESEIRKTTWLREFGNRMDDAKEELLKKLDVAPQPSTRYIMVSMSCHIPVDAVVIVREIVKHHIAETQRKMHDQQIRKSQDLARLIDQDGQVLASLDARIATGAIALSKNLSSGDGTSGLYVELGYLAQEETVAEGRANAAQGKYETFVKEVQEGLTPSLLQEYLWHSDGASGIKQQIGMLEAAKAVAMERYGANSQQVKDLTVQIDSLKARIEDSGADRDRAVAALKQDLQQDVLDAQKNVKAIKDKMDLLHERGTQLAATQFEVAQLTHQERTTSEKLQKEKDELNRLALYIDANNWSTAELAMPADLPDKPSFPKLPITMTLFVAVGLMLGLGIAFLREMMDTSVRSPRDIARVGQLNLLGLIPHEADDPETAGARLPLAIFEAPQSIIAEQFRQVRTRLQHSASLDTVRSLLVTGTSPGDGKTTVACNLAAGLALNGRRILLVDANFRRPQIHTVFNIPNEMGFGDVLNSLDAFDESVRETEVPNLSVLPSGARPTNPTELLESQLLIDFIERALEEYDHVIFDSGPLLIVSETAALAPRVDGVVTVVRARGNSRGMLQRLRDQLRQLKAEHLGVILNAVRSQSGGYYAPMIKSYYAYQTDK